MRKLATDNFSQAHWDVHDVVNYTHHHKNEVFHNHFDDNSRIIETTDDEDDYHNQNQNNGYDPWNQYRIYGGLSMIFIQFIG